MNTFIGKGAHRTIRWAALLIALTVTAASLLQTANVPRTFADTGGYPWPTAPCVWNGNPTGPCSGYDWGESTCPSGDNYCTTANQINGYYIYDQWGEGFRNCTSYAAWMLSTQSSFTMPFYDYAKNWGSRASNLGYTVNMTPAVGSIYYTVTPDPGHVAWVQNVPDSTHVTIEDYNSDTTGDYSAPYTVLTSSASGYIHFKDLQSTASVSNDFDGDHHTDLMFLHKLSDNASANLYAFYQASGFASPGLIERFDSSVGWNWNQMKVATGDANGDGHADLFMLHQLTDGGFNFYIFYGGSSNFAIGNPVAGFHGSNGWSWATTKLLVGDFDGDGKADLMLVTQTTDGGADIFIYTAASNYTSPGYVEYLPGSSGWSWSAMKLAIGDVNNDGISDVLMLHKLTDGGANFYVLYGGSNAFNPGYPVTGFPGSSGWSWDKMKMLAGDFDGDHHADLLMLHELSDNASANLYVFTEAGGFANTTYPVRNFQASSGWNWNKMKISAGDVNNDGISDLFMLHKLTDGGANFYAFHGSSFADVSPSAYFPGSSGYSWDSMLAPMYVQ